MPDLGVLSSVVAHGAASPSPMASTPVESAPSMHAQSVHGSVQRRVREGAAVRDEALSINYSVNAYCAPPLSQTKPRPASSPKAHRLLSIVHNRSPFLCLSDISTPFSLTYCLFPFPPSLYSSNAMNALSCPQPLPYSHAGAPSRLSISPSSFRRTFRTPTGMSSAHTKWRSCPGPAFSQRRGTWHTLALLCCTGAPRRAIPGTQSTRGTTLRTKGRRPGTATGEEPSLVAQRRRTTSEAPRHGLHRGRVGVRLTVLLVPQCFSCCKYARF